MHQYASQTPEARELVAELEFVWDQIKYNTSSSSSSGPLHAVGVPPLSRHQGSSYGSIGGRLAGSEDYDRPNIRADDRNSRLRVLSPVSQPEEEDYYRRNRSTEELDQDLDDDDDEDEYEEARDSLYEDQDPDLDDADHSTNTDTGTHHTTSHSHTHSDPSHRHIYKPSSGASSNISRDRDRDPHNLKNSPWRRRVEQALTKMTAEIAALREQMETRTLANRRRNGAWAWLKWILWTVLRQVLWDLALLGALLIFMRLRGDRRVEGRLRSGWSEVKSRLARFKLLKRVGDMPVLP